MPSPPILTDTAALGRNRARARRPALFLQESAVTEVEERLLEVNRTFTAPAVVAAFPQVWAEKPGWTVVPEAERLGLQPGAHDLVVHAMGLHWANDPVGQLVQCRHALRADGLFLGLMLGGRTLQELRAALAEAEIEISGGLSPRVLPMGEIRDLGGLLARAGFALPVADAFLRPVSYRDPWHLMADLRAMGEGNALAARLRWPTGRRVLERACAIYAARFPAPGGRVTASFEVICLTGWAAHASQQQPLRPGSAAARLADALRATEAPLPRDPADS